MKKLSMRNTCFFVMRCCFVFTLSTVVQSKDDITWLKVGIDRGITVWSRDRTDMVLPELRADGKIEGELFHVLAVILDNKRAPEWIPNCIESREIKRVNSKTTLVYSVTNFPWPVSYLDSVVESTREIVKRGSEYRISMSAKPKLMPLIPGRVRIPYSEIYFQLKKVDEKIIEIEYGLNVDPGGMLPDWIIRSTIKNTLSETIRSLEAQVQKTKDQYNVTITQLVKDLT